jgi:hypothetical protein
MDLVASLIRMLGQLRNNRRAVPCYLLRAAASVLESTYWYAQALLPRVVVAQPAPVHACGVCLWKFSRCSATNTKPRSMTTHTRRSISAVAHVARPLAEPLAERCANRTASASLAAKRALSASASAMASALTFVCAQWEGIDSNLSLMALHSTVELAAMSRKSRAKGAEKDKSMLAFLLSRMLAGGLTGSALTGLITCVSATRRTAASSTPRQCRRC